MNCIWLCYLITFFLIISYPDSQYHTNITPLMEAAIEGHEVIFRLLLEHVRCIYCNTYDAYLLASQLPDNLQNFY